MTERVSILIDAWDLGVDEHLEAGTIDPSQFEEIYLHLYLKLSNENASSMYTLPVISSRACKSANVYMVKALLAVEQFDIRELVDKIATFLASKSFLSSDDAHQFLKELLIYEFQGGNNLVSRVELNKVLSGQS